ncbi:hypothetical protein [Hymenobacter negativus]|uniref:hypothetical protein n=1 Tax=Hymenobacter negativus TaxID=2795026 RepID=UPI0018DDC277|nr:hypothetical protein [Hymenobacter negativus]
MNWFSSFRVRTVLLPLALSAATVLGLGSYYETNDDTTLAWLFSGVLALKPVPSVPLFLHGYGHLLAAAYTAAPGVPWLGLLLGALLGAATVLAFAVLDKLLRPCLRPGPLVLVLTLFFGLAWLEHWLWFSHARVALLLAGMGVLFAAQRPGRRGALLIGLLALGAAWLIRPSLATLGAAAAVPAAVWLAGSWRRAFPVLGSAALGLLLATGILHWQQTLAEARAQRRDAALSRILDFDQLCPQPRTPADSLGTTAIGLWLLGDSTVVNEALIQRAYRFDAADFLTREVPAKLRQRLTLLGRDYFPLLLVLAATAVAVARRRGRHGWFWLLQLGFAGGLILLAGVFKLPPRLGLPLLDFWLLTNLVFWLNNANAASANHASGGAQAAGEADAAPAAANVQRPALYASGERLPWMEPGALPRRGAIAGLLLVITLYVVKTWHRHQVLSQEQRRHESALDIIAVQEARRVRILAGTNDLLKSLSPFRIYRHGRQPVLLLTGWSSHDASQAELRRALTGTSDQTECLRRLAELGTYGSEADALWVLTPETARWLSHRFLLGGPRVQLWPGPLPTAYGADSAAWRYHIREPADR